MKKVLIVDDEKSFLLSLKDGLSVHSDRFQVLTAENGREAVAVLRAQPVDLLVTDLKLPEMNGFELLAWVSRHQPQLPVIVMTAFGTPEIEARLAKLDALQYLEKPLDLEMLQESIFNGLKGGAKSYIRGITLATFLQLMAAEKKNCTLKISSEEQVGYLFVRRGDLIDAEFGELSGEAAALEIVAWENAEIEMDGICRRQQVTISLSMEHILIEAFRRKDEQTLRDQQQSPLSAGNSPSQPLVAGSGGPSRGEAVSRAETTRERPLSAAELVLKRLCQVLSQLPVVQEYAIFDEKSFLEKKNPGTCSLEAYNPAIFAHLVELLEAQFDQGSFQFLAFNTASRYRYLLFYFQQHRILTKLKPGTQPQAVIEAIRRQVNR